MRYLGLTFLLFFYNHVNGQQFHTLSQAKPSVRKWYEEAKMEAQRENTNTSISLLLKCLQKDSILTDAWTLLGNAYYDIGEYKKAISAFTKLSALNPKNPLVRIHRKGNPSTHENPR
jgi:tetratricopeptide (TPR) repeat protein